MSQLVSKKKRLLDKKEELEETWLDIRTFISEYVKKLNCIVDGVLNETDTVAFFQTYPKVSGLVDKILNIFLQVQCEFSLLSCENILDSEVCNLQRLTKHEGSLVEKDSSPQKVEEGSRKVSVSGDLPVLKDAVEKFSHPPEEEVLTRKLSDQDLSITKVDAPKQDLCDSSVDVCTATESSVVENFTRCAINVINTEETVTESVDCVSSVETSFVCEKNDSKSENSRVTPSKQRISQNVIKPNEVLEMIYSHGDNPWNFWLCYYPGSDVEFIQKTVTGMYYTNRLVALSTLPDVGDYVVVADGKKVLRGQVLTVRGTELSDTTCVMLLDIDSGRMKSFKLSCVWEIPEELVSIHAQAVNCQLEGIAGDSSMWSKENLRKFHVDRKFEELLLQTTLSVKFIRAAGDSLWPRYIIDADCIDLETDKIYSVSQLVNSEIVTTIMCKPVVEASLPKGDTTTLQNSFSTPLSRESDEKNMEQSNAHVTNSANEISGNVVSQISEHSTVCMDDVNGQQVRESCMDGTNQKGNSSSSNFMPTIQTNLSCPDYIEIISQCETSCSDVILDVEETVDSNCQETVEQAIKLMTTEVSTIENSESTSSVVASIYCERDIVLEKINYSFLLNETVIGIPTFVDSPSLFYVQIFLDENDEFTDLQEKMAIFYSENKIKFSTKEEAQNVIKSYCVARYPQDRQWYRVEIIDWMPSTERSVCVCFVDIGDKLLIELDLVQPLAKQFAKVPVLAQKCHLHGVTPLECAMNSYVSYEWSASSLSVFRNALNLDHVFNMQVKEFTSYGSLGVVLVDPKSPEASINEKLVTLGEAKRLLDEENLSVWDPMKEEYERYMHHPYNDEDACQAVTGYSPRDEQRFCKFYARDGKCFKGNNCRKEHVLSHAGGWISDKEEVFQEAFSQIVLPEVGETVYLQVTCVVRINLFYVILNVDDNPEEETLLTLNKYINDKNNLKNLRMLEVTPAVGQLVLAHYQQDGIWYRARVIDTDNDNNMVQVFFVDYGNSEWVSEVNVRDIDPQYLHLPFQAIESSLAFAEMNVSVDDDSLETVISLFRYLTDCTQPLRAKIISKNDVVKKLELQLYDTNDHDIALTLADTGYVNITNIQMTPATAFGVPG